MTALVIEEMAKGKTIPNLIWRSLAGFSDLLTVKLQREAEGGLGKLGS